ncbi:MAG: hypothetical protein WKG00_04905 [Polyangiaceae bacterium]
MSRRVRGILFADYVRMVRGLKSVDWSKWLTDDDLQLVRARIDYDTWYPMETFERCGVGILAEVADGQLEAVRMWGRFQVDTVRNRYPDVVAEGDPCETVQRFQVLRRTFFDYDALRVVELNDGGALLAISFGMGPVAEEAASTQTMGFFEGLLERAGATSVYGRFTAESWRGAPVTRMALDWEVG